MSLNKITYFYFLFLFSLIPISIVVGSAASLINIVLIDLSFILFVIYKKDFSFLKTNSLKYLLILYIYLVFNSFISLDLEQSLLRNFGFIRFVILFAAFNYFFLFKDFYKKVIKNWALIILIILTDVYIESFFGKNILGYGEAHGPRIVSFFKNEPVVGGFLLGFFFLLMGFLTDHYKKKKKFIPYLFLVFMVVGVLLTGERASVIKILLGSTIIIFLINEIDLKKKIFILFSIIVLMILVTVNSKFLKIRINQLTDQITNQTIYYDLYKSGFQVFINHKMFGVGNKNYRIETCEEKRQINIYPTDKYYCSTHPHQIYFEILSEHGIIGSLIIFIIFYKLIFSKIIETLKSKSYQRKALLLYLLLVFAPLIPSGAFFGSFLLTIFMINLSLFYALEKKRFIYKFK